MNKVVNTPQELKTANTNYQSKVVSAMSASIKRLGNIHVGKSVEILDRDPKLKYTGALVSSIHIQMVGGEKVLVIAGGEKAPHAYNIETGTPPIRKGWVTFEESPALKDWVEMKLSIDEPELAIFFLRKKAVRVGMNGFPYGYPDGVHFFQLGFEHTLALAPQVVIEELRQRDISVVGG